MKKVVYLAALCCLLLLTACGQTPAAEVAEATAVATENTAIPTESPTEPATATVAPTNTTAPTETATAAPTDTPEPTATPTAVPTETPTTAPTATQMATAVPSTPTTAPPAPAAAPPPAPAPAGPNLLNNSGFEQGGVSWEVQNSSGQPNIYAAADKPQFVHSGQQSAVNVGFWRTTFFQRVSGDVIVPGTTYRAGVWVKIWSSSGEDRTVSQNPGDVGAQVCINVTGESDRWLDTSVCSGIVRPIDTWQFISVDAVAQTERIAILLVAGYTGSDRPAHNEVMWDDATMGTAPSAATATPPPAAEPVRPNPIVFNPTALRDSMNGVRSAIEQAGGLLDRLYNGQGGTCAEYQQYYDDTIRSATYSGVPDDWAGIYNDYIFAVENFLATNESINSLCDGGGGVISALNYGAARTGINDSLNRLIPAIEAANAKIGG
ncbi:MAG: hypothetical protein IPM53_23225 [Anaerolineaceae bacterium]|nr:hypothetical protein [Anaerolineaceae bacterium]